VSFLFENNVCLVLVTKKKNEKKNKIEAEAVLAANLLFICLRCQEAFNFSALYFLIIFFMPFFWMRFIFGSETRPKALCL